MVEERNRISALTNKELIVYILGKNPVDKVEGLFFNLTDL
ncbi:hypothetical protein PFLA_a3721 [Pseudoalteromonas flavipulchra NCIMB 2033 = ATCC BAA-314]|nr:hypothetical protein [Pseudoalteromonas flavipulchra NCIMB 2033 = ATCC BAA-314]